VLEKGNGAFHPTVSSPCLCHYGEFYWIEIDMNIDWTCSVQHVHLSIFIFATQPSRDQIGKGKMYLVPDFD
jgi:hypothetical protein